MNYTEPTPILNLTREQYLKQDARESRVWSLVNSGKYDRGSAEHLVEIERMEAAGEKLLPQVAGALKAHRAALDALAEAQEQHHAALQIHSRRETLKARRDDILKKLAGERQQVAECRHLVGDGRVNVVGYYESLKIHSPSWRDAAIGAGKYIAGAETAAKFISEIVIPPLEKQLAEAEHELSIFQKEIDSGIRAVAESAA